MNKQVVIQIVLRDFHSQSMDQREHLNFEFPEDVVEAVLADLKSQWETEKVISVPYFDFLIESRSVMCIRKKM